MAYNTVLTGSDTGSPHCDGDESLRNGSARNLRNDTAKSLCAGDTENPSNSSAGASHNGGTMYGYARVSAQDQRLARQLDALETFGVPPRHVYADKASGRDFDRPAWQALMSRISPGDTLVVKSIDRLGRNYDEILTQWHRITRECGASIVVLDMPLLDTRHSAEGVTGELIADIVLQLLSYVAHVERENIRQRQAEGIAAARARGVRFGRPRKERPEQYELVLGQFARGELTRRVAAERLGVCPGTFDRWRHEDERQC